jgi:hypothetical protein
MENIKISRTKKGLRNFYVKKEQFKKKNKWVLETPSAIRDEAINDLLKAYQTNFAKKKKEVFKIKYQSKKSESESIVIRVSDWYGAGVFFLTILGRKPIKSIEPLPETLNYDCRQPKAVCPFGAFYKKQDWVNSIFVYYRHWKLGVITKPLNGQILKIKLLLLILELEHL